jgi:hypothetical protein
MGIEAFEAPQSRYGGRWCALEIDGPPQLAWAPSLVVGGCPT